MDKNISYGTSKWTTNVIPIMPKYEKNTINKTSSFKNDLNNKLNDKCNFNRGNSNRHSKIKNDNFIIEKNSNDYNQIAYCNQNTETQFLYKIPNLQGPLGIHVIPTYDLNTQKDMGLIIQCIEQSGRIFKDGCLKCGDRIIEINNTTIIGVNFENAQEILRGAMKGNELLMKIVREDDNSMIRITPENTDHKVHVENDNDYNESNNDSDYKTDNDINSKEIEIEFVNINDYCKDDEIVSYCNNNKTNLNASNTKRIGKKIHVQLTKGPQGLGFKLAARDNPTGEISPIYIKNILPKGAAITDGRLQRGDRLLEVNNIDMTQRNLHEAVAILRNTKLGSLVNIVVSRQMQEFPREMSNEEREINQQTENMHRELLTYEIALNDTGSAGLGVSVKGKTKKVDDNESTIDLGIFIKTVINGGAASKDGRLKPNDQLININGFSLLGKSNEEAMKILRDAMQVETKPGYIQLTVSRKIRHSDSFKSNIPRIIEKMPDHAILIDNDFNMKCDSKHALDTNMQFQTNTNELPTEFDNFLTERNDEKEMSVNNNDEFGVVKKSFTRDAPARRSMSEKRKIYNDPNQTSHLYKNLKSSKNPNTEINKLTDFIRVGSFESVISRSGETKSNIQFFTTPIKQFNQQTSFVKNNENKNYVSVNHLKQQYLQMIEIKNKSNNNNKSVTQNNINNIFKSTSMESIPSVANINNNEKINDKIDNKQFNGNSMDIKDTNDVFFNNESFRNFNGSNDNFYPLTNILNRQRTINRSFRNAVDKSFDKPSSEILDDFNNGLDTRVNRMHHLRMSSQSDDTRKLKKSKKGIIETFQNLFKSNKRQAQEQKCPVQLLTYQHKNCDIEQNQQETFNNQKVIKQKSSYNDDITIKNNSKNINNEINYKHLHHF